MSKALVVYGTRYGAAASTAQEIAQTLRQTGLDVRVVNVKEEKVKDISEYALVVVGSGIQINRWTSEPEKFLQTFQKELAKRKLALFVCCGAATPLPDKTNPEAVTKAKQKYLDEKAAKFSLQPVALGFFGGIYNYNAVPWWAKRAFEADRPRIEAAFKATGPDVYDTRDLNAIRVWAEGLVQKQPQR
jgi:menaquinone-dependent protoporphyrinogen IX oxidase